MNAENRKEAGCPQRDSAEHEKYVGVQSVGGQEVEEQDGADLLERILSRGNLNNAYKRVRANRIISPIFFKKRPKTETLLSRQAIYLVMLHISSKKLIN